MTNAHRSVTSDAPMTMGGLDTGARLPDSPYLRARDGMRAEKRPAVPAYSPAEAIEEHRRRRAWRTVARLPRR